MAKEEKVSQPVQAILGVYKDGWTGETQVSIGDGDSGYRLYGPKFNGSSKAICEVKISESDAVEIRRYLDAAFPKKRKKNDKSS